MKRGKIDVSVDILYRVLGFPKGVRIIDARWKDGSVEFLLEGDPLPEGPKDTAMPPKLIVLVADGVPGETAIETVFALANQPFGGWPAPGCLESKDDVHGW